ncbi:MAG: hypothetical protein ACR2LU_13400 [Luteitalea sp.]|nr:hypothetical protein [Acidobacteriota bacterium]
MLRLVDRVFGEGALHDRDDPAPLRVGYELDVYREWAVHGSEMTPGDWVIEGHLIAPADRLAALAGHATPFRLAMDDGRHLEVFVLDPHGTVVNVEGTAFTHPAR